MTTALAEGIYSTFALSFPFLHSSDLGGARVAEFVKRERGAAWSAAFVEGKLAVAKSVLEAIQTGHWDFEPLETPAHEFSATDALPGSADKLNVLAERIRKGLPLWHPNDRRDCEGLFEIKRGEM